MDHTGSQHSLHSSNLNLHRVLQSYKQQEQERSTLENKINVMKQQCAANRKKAKGVRKSLDRLSNIKDRHSRSQDEVVVKRGRLICCWHGRRKTTGPRLPGKSRRGITARAAYWPSKTQC